MNRSAALFWWKEELPKDVAYLWKNHSFEPWRKKLYSEILAEKVARQNRILESKRDCPKIKPAFIHVFYNNTTFFGGWWIYIITLKKHYSINFRNQNNPAMVLKAMELFPCGVLPINDNFNTWANAFANTYSHIGFKRKKAQGLVKCWVHLDEYDRIIDLGKIKN